MPEDDPGAPETDPNSVTIEVEPQPPAPPPTPIPTTRRQREPKTFSEEEVEAIRQEEKQKLYSRLGRVDDLEAQLTELQRERDERAKAEAKAQREVEAAKKKAAEEEMSAKELIAAKEQEWQARLEAEAEERRKLEAIMEQERRYASLQTYMAQRMAVEAQYIADELRDLVSGNNEQEVDASIEDMKRRSASIMDNVMSLRQQETAGRRMVGITSPPVGPTEMGPATQTLTVDDLKNLSAEDYATHREALLRAASPQRRQ
jgi:hypothetical protein